MKKLLATLALAAVAAFAVCAQNTTRIGQEHAVNFGAYYGYSSNTIANHGGLLLDLNARNSNLRTRFNFEVDQVKLAVCPSFGVNVQYLAKLAEGFFLYPFAGAAFEYHKASNWEKNCDFAPEAGLGLEYQFSSNFGIFAQGKYRYGITGSNSFIMGQAGILFAFGPGRSAATVNNDADRIAAKEAKAAADKAAKEAEAARIAAEKKAAAEKAAADAEAARLAEQKALEEAAAAEAAKRVSVHNILFPLGSSFVNEEGRTQIAEAVAILVKYPDAVVEICGYADKETGNDQVNKDLSEKRANAVKTFFTSAGIPEQNIKVKFFGSDVNPFSTPEANRVVVVTTK